MKVKIFLNVNISLTRLFVETKVKSSKHKNCKTEMKSIPDGKYLLKEAIYHRTLRNYSKMLSNFERIKFYSQGNHQKIYGFLMISGETEVKVLLTLQSFDLFSLDLVLLPDNCNA